MFFLTGKIIQTKYKAFDTNPYMSIPIGFVFFSTATLIVYTPLIILHLPGVLFIVFEALKDLAIFIIIWMHRKYIKVNFDWKKILIIFIGSAIMAAVPAIITLVKEQNDYPFHLQRSYNVYLRQYNGAKEVEPWKDGNVYNSWYMFNSVIIELFKLNGDYQVWWMQSSMVAVISTTTILSLIKIAFKKIRVIALLLIIFMISVIVFRSINVFGLHSNIIGFISTTIIMLIMSWELFKMPRVRYILLTGATGFAMLSFDWSALWLYSTYMCIFIGMYIYKEKPKPTLLILFTLTFIGFMFATSIHRFTTIGSTIGMVTALIIGGLFLWLRNKNFEEPMDKLLFRFRKWWLPVLFTIFMIVSLSIWLSKSEMDLWFNFGIETSYLNTLSSSKSLATAMYVIYWIVVLIGISFIFYSFKQKKKWDIGAFLILIGVISTLFFFSPFTAPFIRSYFIPKALFSSLQWTTVAPLLIGIVLKTNAVIIRKIKFESSAIDRITHV
ncbi:hypothetical protein C4B25_01900 [Mycoplasma todarodis]|uniref:Uncharacterized protein n=2 Tax=Mycoplasma todarodis TaxID=1937191 RepID=A0A4V2NI76_9MOLU|nr:hypothetical protein C4B25_01900 [Mycoplasma todarodis]